MIDADALAKIRREVGDVKIVAATKTVPADIINSLKDYGVAAAGENRVQEFLGKYGLVSGIEWHFIGQLQTNKVKFIVDKVSMIQSVDRTSLIDEIQRQCEKAGKIMDVLIELNAGEDSKGGVAPNDLQNLINYALQKKNVRVKGLMSIPPVGADKTVYRHIGEIFRQVKGDFDGIEFLSMGMSADYKIAVEHGANIIRPGSILFGKRN